MSHLIRNRFLTTGLLFVLAAATLPAQDAGRKVLHGHRPALAAQLPAQGRLADAAPMNLAIGLPLRNQGELSLLLQDLYNPASPNYHKFLSPAQFAEKFGPSEEDYQKVAQFAKQHGLKVTGTHPNRLVLDVSGPAANVAHAFQVKFNTYHHPKENRDFFAPDSEPSVPAGLSVADISGLDNLRRPRPHSTVMRLDANTATANLGKGTLPRRPATAKASNGSGPFGTYAGNDFRNAYIPGTALNGSGQSVALVQFDGYYASDIQAYETLVGRTNIPLQNILLDGFSGAPTGTGGEIEVSLDIEMALAMAPALAKIYVYEGDPFNFHPNDVLSRIATDNLAHQISCSWGWIGGPSATTDNIFQQMAVQGQSFFVASGDSDAYPAGTVDSPFGFGTPSDSSYVTSVGGTTLTMTPGATAKVSETVWNWGIEYGADGIGSSGGISSYYQIPYWQTNVSMTACQGSTVNRNFPDVALTADNVLVIADGGVEYLVGGTSCAAPLWAGFTSMLNQQGVNSGHAAIGFLNPYIYHLAASTTSFTNAFNDITTGNNKWSGSPTLFNAVTNYDLATGLGTPNGTNLINAILGSSTYSVHVSPPTRDTNTYGYYGYGPMLSYLNGGSPNGTWTLFVMDDSPTLVGGMISNGWFMTLTMANPVGFVADLGLTMSVTPTNPLPGSNVLYSLTLTNYGYSTSTNVVVTLSLPTGAAYVTNSPLGTNQLVLVEGSQISWAVTGLTNGLANGQGAALNFTITMPAAGGSVQTIASAQATTPDPNPDNNTVAIASNVAFPPAPVLSAVVGGSGHGFQLTITNSPGQSVIIQASTNLLSWISILTNTEPFTFTNFDSTNFPTRFYRAVTGP